ncbi:putative ribonuclease H-like domain-containing protein [Tanacetum coccineum]
MFVPQTAQENGTLVTKMSVPVTAEEKTNKKNDVKARSLLLMVLPNEHQLTFSQYNDAKTMFAAIKARFGGNEATKKTHKILFKQQYENFSVSSAESLDFIFNRLQNIVIWMNKAKIETMSIDDLYKNFKIVEQKVKKSIGTSSGAQNLAFMTAPSISSTNDLKTAKPAYEVSTVSPNVNTASPQVSTTSFSDNAVYAFMLSLLSMWAKRYYQRTGKKIFINANDTAGYDKSKVECFNYHKMGHFFRECRAPRNKEGQFRNQDNTKKHGNNEDTSSKAMLAIDDVGFDWSDMAEEQVQTNMALMAFSDSEIYNDETCSKTCLKNYETLKKQCDDLIVKLNQTEFTAATYKRGLATIEEQLITYRKNEVLFSEEFAVLKWEVACKNYEINILKSEFEKVKQEKEGIEFKIEKSDKASKDLYKLPKKLDLSYSSLDEFKEPKFKGYGSEDSKKESNIVCDKKLDDSKENYGDSLVESAKPKNHEKAIKKSVRTHRNAQRNMVSRAVLMKTGLKPFNTARTVNTAHPKSIVFSVKPMLRFSKTTQSTIRRPFQAKPVLTNKRFTQKVNTAKAQAVNTARPKVVKTARTSYVVVNAVRVNQENAVKASACWVWRPTKPDSASITLKKHNYIDARGRSKSMMAWVLKGI